MTRPNILHIFVDQQRFDTIGAMNNPVIHTPNLERLVSMGTTFTNAYTPSPVCIAARCSMIHGQYPAHTGCYENTVVPTDGRQSFMTTLTEHGYRTHAGFYSAINSCLWQNRNQPLRKLRNQPVGRKRKLPFSHAEKLSIR
jgi:arylsulfatase A-like enzyme